ncbi:MAG TPA: serine--tRNA ligase, partial [Porticoccaceae bacterium]|nr:serine--tRNA ligase [Porticoccaceae bacterium]
QVEVESLQAQRNKRSKSIGQAKAAGEDIEPLLAEVNELKSQLEQIDGKLNDIQARLDDILWGIPNIPDPQVPEGASEDDNVEIHRWGEVPSFDFEVRDHVDLGAGSGQLDFEGASKITGSRFAVMHDQLALMHRALIQFMLNTHTQEHGYREVYVPFVVNSDSLRGTGQLPKFEEDLFKLHGDQAFYLIPTAEV